jgi:hypothetical protein
VSHCSLRGQVDLIDESAFHADWYLDDASIVKECLEGHGDGAFVIAPGAHPSSLSLTYV